MKISFDSQNKEYIEIKKSNNTIQIIQSVKDSESKKRLAISQDLSEEDWKKIVKEIGINPFQ